MTDNDGDPYSESDMISRRGFIKGITTGILGIGAGVSVFGQNRRIGREDVVKRYNSGEEPDVIIRNTIPSDCKVNLDYTQVTENGVNSVSLVVNSDEEDMYDAIKAEAHFLYPNDTRDETVSVFRETKDQSNLKVESYREEVAERIKIKISHYRDSRS